MIKYPDPGSRSAAYAERARKVLPGGHTRLTVFFEPYPLYAASGAGAHVVDADGNRLLDFIGNYSAAIHGHCFPPIVKALRKQVGVLGAVGMPTESEIELAELLAARLAPVEQLRFCNSGSEAVMLAIKAARAHTGRPKIAKLEGAYHGSYTGVEASTLPDPGNWGDATRPASLSYAAGTPPGVLSDTVILPCNDPVAAVEIIDAVGPQLAAIVIDPAMSRTGYVGPDPAFIAAVQEAARASGALIIADEVYSLRLAYHGAHTLMGLKPDLIAIGKIIGGGIPVGAVGGSAAIMSVFAAAGGRPRLPHGGTFNANPLAMAAGLAAMHAMTPEAYAHLDVLGSRLRAGFKSLAQTGQPIQVNGRGSLTAFAFARGRYTNVREQIQVTEGLAGHQARFHQAMLRRGILCTPGGQFVISTPMTERDIDTAIEAARDALAEMQSD